MDKPEETGGVGDISPLLLNNPVPGATIFKGGVAWHESVGGQLQFRYPANAMNEEKTAEKQEKLNGQQEVFNKKK